ncbi:MAG: hypothetical protein ICV66_04600 [Chitinophagaceae bacterium]|nr:hypothetical protein [Chitinophagaceae bacterium]
MPSLIGTTFIGFIYWFSLSVRGGLDNLFSKQENEKMPWRAFKLKYESRFPQFLRPLLESNFDSLLFISFLD